MPSKVASAPAVMSTPPPKKKKGGFFGCRSKHALDSLPRNARGDNAAIHRLQARNVFAHTAQTSDSSTSTAATASPFDEKKLPEATTLTFSPPETTVVTPIKPLYAQEVIDDADGATLAQKPPVQAEAEEIEEEARDLVLDDIPLAPPSRPTTPGAVRSLSVASKSGRIKRSLSLKRSGSSASASLVARAPPVSSSDFADLPESSSSSSDLAQRESLGDMASIRKARGRHQSSVLHQHTIADISEDDYLTRETTLVAPEPVLITRTSASALSSAEASGMHESDSMRAVAAALEGSNDSYCFQPGPAVGTPKLEPPSPTKSAYAAEIRSQRAHSEDTVAELPAARGFWDTPVETEECGPGRTIPFQYVTNLARPVSIASLRSLACPNTPPRTSSRPTSPDGTYSGAPLRAQRSFSNSPLKRQATFNGFPRAFFPGSTALRHSPSIASHTKRKPVPQAIPALEFQHPSRPQDDEENAVERQLGCANCGSVSDQREFAAFVAKGKASRRTPAKQSLIPTPSTASLRRKRTGAADETLGEATLKRWGLAEAFKASTQQDETPAEPAPTSPARPAKKMVPGPGGRYITDTANVRWCSALDEIKKALAVPNDDEDEEHAETTDALRDADALLAKLGVETN